MNSPSDIIAQLRRDLEETQQSLGTKFYALRQQLDQLEKECQRAPIAPAIEPPPLPSSLRPFEAKISAPTEELVEVPNIISPSEAELQQEAPPLSPAEDSKLIDVFSRPLVIPRDLPQEAPPVTDRTSSAAEVDFGRTYPLIIGIVLVVLALAYFLKYSFDQNWVGPIGRVLMAYLASGALLVAGEFFRRRKFDQFGLYLAGGGIASLYLSTFAGYAIYHLLPVWPAFGLMILVTILAGLLAVSYNVMWLAVLGLIGGFATPLVLSTGQSNQIGLMSYMLILNGGILGLAFFKRWNLLTYLGFGFTWLLFSAWFAQDYETAKAVPTLFFLNAFFLIYALAPFVYYFIKERRGDLTGFAISLPNAFFAFAYSYYIIRQVWGVPYVGVTSVIYAALYLGLAQYLYRRNPEFVGAFVLLLAKAILFLVITIPVLFSKQWITIFWAIQAAVVLWAGGRLQSDWLRRGGLVLLVLTIGKFLFYDYPVVFFWQLHGFSFGPDYWAGAPTRYLTTLVLLAAVFYVAKNGNKDGWWIIGAGLLFWVLNTETSGFFRAFFPYAQAPALSILWALFAVGLIRLWFSRAAHDWLRWSGVILFGLTIGKFLLYDYAQAFDFNFSPLSFRPDYFANLPTRWITTLAVLAAIVTAARTLRSTAWHVTSLLLLFFILNTEVGGFFHDMMPRAKFAGLSVLWGLFAIGLLMFGFKLRNSSLRSFAFYLFGATILKVFLIDMANVSTPFRIVSVMVLGLLLIGASFLYYRYRDQLQPPEDKPPSL